VVRRMTTGDGTRVITHDGHRADERPMAVVIAGERHDIVRIDETWMAAGVDESAPVRRGFVVRCRGGARFRLVLTEGAGWEVTELPGPRLVTADPPSQER
jgi:hypothetical protein